MNRLRALLATLALLAPTQLAAAETGSGLQFSPVLRMLGGLGLVAGLILGGYGLLRNRFGGLPSGRKRAVRLLESCPLGPRKSVCLVRVRDREFVLGVTQQQISLLGELPSLDDEQEPDFSESFGRVFASVRRGDGG